VEVPLRQLVTRNVPVQEVSGVLSESMVKIWQALPKYQEKGQFLAFCKKIALRTCYDFWRGYYRNTEVQEADLTKASRTFENWLESRDKESWLEGQRLMELRSVLDAAMSDMCPEDRMVLQMVYLEQRSAMEAAEVMGISWANVKVRLFRARKRLKMRLIKMGVRSL
jgi:RNA polymerase sigma-70 factor (ECF subfamily)